MLERRLHYLAAYALENSIGFLNTAIKCWGFLKKHNIQPVPRHSDLL